MSTVVCPVLPFPNLLWWHFAGSATHVLLDDKEHFEKMSFRNRYMVAGADGPIVLSIPVAGGRQQRKPMEQMQIDNKTNWQVQHWRTLTSVYNRSPYFEFFAPDLEPLFQQPFLSLTDFSLSSMAVLEKIARIRLEKSIVPSFKKHYDDSYADIRGMFRSSGYERQEGLPVYHQTFEDRTGFLPNLSLLDLLFAEGNNTASYFRH